MKSLLFEVVTSHRPCRSRSRGRVRQSQSTADGDRFQQAGIGQLKGRALTIWQDKINEGKQVIYKLLSNGSPSLYANDFLYVCIC